MTMSVLSSFCNYELIGIVSLIVVVETLIIIIQQIIIHTKGVSKE